MKQIINLNLLGRKLSFPEGKKEIKAVSDNDCFYLRLETEEQLPLAVFARFTKKGNLYTDVLLDENLMCNIPENMLESGEIEIGFYSEGFATSVLRLRVISSVVRKEGIEDTAATPSQTEQLIALVNSLPVIEGAEVNEEGQLVLRMKNSEDFTAGYVKGEKGDTYSLTDADKAEIAELSVLLLDSALLETVGTGEV